MSGRNSSKIRRISLGAMLTALGVVFLYLGAVTDVLDLTFAAAASLITVFAFLEFGRAYAYMILAATAVLSFTVLPSKVVALMYAASAFYTIIKADIEKLGKKLGWVLKLLYLNVVTAVLIWASKYIFMLPDDGTFFDVTLILLANAAFILYDIAVTRLAVFYVFKLRKKYKIDKFLRG